MDTDRENVEGFTVRHCGLFTVYIQGILENLGSKAVFLTLHDMGTNHKNFLNFINHPSMSDIKERSVFIHVDLPGQEDFASDLPEDFVFPSLDVLGSSLVDVLDELKLDYVIGIAEGAGANIMVRFGLAHPDRCLGLVLIHCTSTVAGMTEQMRDKVIGWKLDHCGMNHMAENYLLFHKFGRTDSSIETNEDIQDYQKKLRTSMNPRNLRRYVDAFLNRTDLSAKLETDLKTNCLLVSGTLASHLHTVHTMASHMNKSKTSLLLLDHVGDVLTQSPEKLSEALQLFVQGLGKLTFLPLPTLKNRSPSRESIQEAQDATPSDLETYEFANERRPSISKSR